MQGFPHEVAVETPRRGRRGLGVRRPGNRKDDISVARIGSLRALHLPCLIALTALLPLALFAADLDLSELPAPHAGRVEFHRDIRPILENACFRCHGPERPRSGFRLDNRASVLEGGDLGPAIFPGNSADSPLIHYVARLVRDMEMPPTGKGDPLKPFEIALLRAWIDQGADYGGADQPERARLAFDLTTGAGHVTVSGDRARFREQSWMNDGWSGGVTEFRASGPLNEHTTFTLDGRVLFEQDNARLRFDVRRKDWGGFAGGVEIRRRWYDDSGGFHPSFTPPQFAVDEELALDFGRAWFDLYLDRAGWPEARLGYELQFRDGTESSTRWGTVTTPTRNVYPNFREVDEHTHILKFDVAQDVAGWRVEDSLRVEWHDQDNRRV
ncbi:MAG TPA: c-type cytochrome domain-containing protein, partial [Verrucomicrobiae bacterium]|nr:c-type cytochrome domain-containing protein [Verrucomicrobiae bacterium]